MLTEVLLFLSVALSQIASSQALSLPVNPDSRLSDGSAVPSAIVVTSPGPCTEGSAACLLVRTITARQYPPAYQGDPSPTLTPATIIGIFFGVAVFLIILSVVLRRYCGPTSETVAYTRTTHHGRSNDAVIHQNSILNTHEMATTHHQHLAVAQDMNNAMTTSHCGTTTTTTMT